MLRAGNTGHRPPAKGAYCPSTRRRPTSKAPRSGRSFCACSRRTRTLGTAPRAELTSRPPAVLVAAAAAVFCTGRAGPLRPAASLRLPPPRGPTPGALAHWPWAAPQVARLPRGGSALLAWFQRPPPDHLVSTRVSTTGGEDVYSREMGPGVLD